ncbi:MAG: SIMPL domain-containing protein [Lachnoclostridium sp.]|nr:SIMPL domain-containing protein [Lachnoclostridium sp.]
MLKNYYPATIIALALVILGLCLKSGIDNFTNKDRRVTVKGLAETEVNADHVTWPLKFNQMGNSLPDIYEKMGQTQNVITSFLTNNGIKSEEITISAPSVEDLDANQYRDNKMPYRYILTATITVSSDSVDLVRKLIDRQGELLKEGIAVYSNTYDTPVTYDYVSFQAMKPAMMAEAIKNAEATAKQFAENSHSKLNKIVNADQGQFSISDRDNNTPFIKRVRVVTTITYSLKN